MKTLGVDGNFYLHRFHSVLSSRPPENLAQAMCSMFISNICKDALATKCGSILVAFDGPEVFRYKLYADYKASRVKKVCGASPYDYLEDVKSELSRLGIPNMQLKQYEADDVLASLAVQHAPCVMATRDKDAYQYLKEGIVLYDATHKVSGKPSPKVTKYTDVRTIFGVEPSQCVELQILIGDGVDTIKGVMGRAKAVKGLAKWGSIKAWAANDETFRALVSENYSQLKRNQKLVTLVKTIKIPTPRISWSQDPNVPLSYIKLKEFCNPKSKGLF